MGQEHFFFPKTPFSFTVGSEKMSLCLWVPERYYLETKDISFRTLEHLASLFAT